MRIFVMIALCALLSGCVNDRMGSRLASWQGAHFNDVAATWGAPDECSVDDPQRICIWKVRPIAADAMPTSIYQSSCTTMLAFDTEDRVTGWRWRGDKCQQTASIVAVNRSADRPDLFSSGAEDETAPGVATAEPVER